MADTISIDERMTPRLLNVPDTSAAMHGTYGSSPSSGRTSSSSNREDGTVRGRSSSSPPDDPSFDDVRGVPLDVYDVVDEQRLTTCIVLPDILLDRLEALSDPDAPSNRRRLLGATVGGVRRPKLRLGADISDYWQQAILEVSRGSTAPRSQPSDGCEGPPTSSRRGSTVLERTGAMPSSRRCCT